MNTDGTFYICESCRQVVEADAPGIVRAHELIDVRTFGGDDEPIEGLGVFFHDRCYPTHSRRYRRAPSEPLAT